ncbi:SGNH/GDSL hydrolase family protein [Acidovorax lacteus]|uniref:GDSL family lipase n=1 Tax=Acidovorax lacteus TaxID=1924988 RepID=A0ABP8LDB2_9BURK
MAVKWMRRTALVAAVASATLLAACGSSTTESAITPDRFIAFGDGLTDIGQKGTRYTVNNGSVNNWTLQLVSRYGKTLAPAASGGLSYATGNARTATKPDAAGNASTPTVTDQVSQYLAGGGTFGKSDIVLMNAGVSDVIAHMAAVTAGSMTPTQMVDASRQAGQALGQQVRRLVQAGAKYVVVTGTYDLGKTPWAKTIGREGLLSDASSRFNEGLLVEVVDLGANVLYIDTAYYVNLYVGTPGSYGFNNATTPVCISVDASNGIGIGAGQVNSALCTGSTLLANAAADAYVFADPVYLTPSAHRQLGNYAYDRLRARW